jgi:PAS domain-containing protein
MVTLVTISSALVFLLDNLILALAVTVVGMAVVLLLTNIVVRHLESSMDAENKAVEEKNAMAYLESILNGLDMMIYVTDPKTGDILFINDIMKML